VVVVVVLVDVVVAAATPTVMLTVDPESALAPEAGLCAVTRPTLGSPAGTVLVTTSTSKPLLRKVAVAKFTRTMGTMLTSGVAILEALDIVAKTAGNRSVEKAIYNVRSGISEGRTMADPLTESGVFPPMVCQMISVGESTGALDAMLEKIADFYDEEVDQAVENMTALIEPIMLVFLGVTIGGLVIAMYLPIFKMAGAI